MSNDEMEALGTAEEWEIPDASDIYDHGKAQRFMLRVIEEARADGLNLIELRYACEWVAAACNARMAAAMESLALAQPPLEHDVVDELVDAVDDGDGDGDSQAD